MTPQVRQTVLDIKQWSRDNILDLRRAALHLQDASDESPAELGNPSSPWSEKLQQQTRDAIEQLPVTADGHLHFKHPTLGAAYATLSDLCNDRLVLHSKSDLAVPLFDDVDALLQAGWALD